VVLTANNNGKSKYNIYHRHHQKLMFSLVDMDMDPPLIKYSSLFYIIILFRLENTTCIAVYSKNEPGNVICRPVAVHLLYITI